MEDKPHNNTWEPQGHKHDEAKLRFDLIPPELLTAVATILTFGAEKYSPNNWQTLDNFNDRFTAALMRHLNTWRSGEINDPESGKPHLWHVACNVAFLIWREDKQSKEVADMHYIDQIMADHIKEGLTKETVK